jgi:type IV secretion system protein VirD4
MRRELQRPPAVPDTLSPGDQLLAASLGLTAAAGGLVWASGQLAGLAFGHAWLDVDPAEVAGVLWQLPHHLGNPELAWPAPAQRALPGSAGMYGSFAATTAAAATAADGVMRLWQRAGLGKATAPGARGRRQAAGSATWASPQELRPLRVRRPEPGRVILGRTGGAFGRLLAAEDCHSVLVFGPPDSFKTTGLVIPAILGWTGPVLATSVKPDVIRATRAHRERRGQVVVLDPLGVSGDTGARWTPLAGCTTWAGAQQTAEVIAATADLGGRAAVVTAEHKYWKTLGTKLLAPLLFAAARDGRSMTDVLRWIDLREDNEVTKLLADADADGAITAWEASQSRTDKARDSVYGTAEDLLAIYADQRVQHFTSGHDLDAEAFLQADNTLYLYAPVHEQRRLRPLFETVTMQLVRVAQEQAASAPDGKLDPRFLCALDEAGNVAALELLPEWATTGRGQGIQLLSVWHDQAQLVHRYGDRAATILNGHRAKVFLSGLADVGALELGSRLIGDQAVVETNYATDPTGRVSASQATSWRPLVPLEELRRLQPGEGVVVYGHLRPVRIQVRPHFTPRERRWRQRLERQATRHKERAERRAARALERADRRAVRQHQRLHRRLPGWARGREEASRDR